MRGVWKGHCPSSRNISYLTQNHKYRNWSRLTRCVGFVPGRMVMSAWSCSYGLFNDAVCRSNAVTFSE